MIWIALMIFEIAVVPSYLPSSVIAVWTIWDAEPRGEHSHCVFEIIPRSGLFTVR